MKLSTLVLAPLLSSIITICPSLIMAQSHTGNNNFFQGTYIAAGAGVSLPQGKIKNGTIDSSGNNYYISKKLKDGGVFKIALGKDFGMVRSEVEFMLSPKHKFSLTNAVSTVPFGGTLTNKFHTSYQTYFINTFYDFKNLHSTIKPYLGFGLGFSKNTLSKQASTTANGRDFFIYQKKSGNSFAWNLSVGSMVNLNKNIYLDFSYRFVDLGKIKGSTTLLPSGVSAAKNVKGNIRNHIFLAGMGLKF